MLIDKNLVKAIEDEHVKWFVKLAEKKDCSWSKKKPQKRKDYLSNFFKFNSSIPFEKSIRPFLVGDKVQIEKLKSKLGKIGGTQATHLLEAFGYKEFKGNRKIKWGVFRFCEALEVDVCPYCKRQYTFTVKDDGKNYVARPEIDHFYPQHPYPYLSCNLYNFIPSCHICNNIKSSKVKNILYPYDDDFDTLGEFKLFYRQNSLSGSNVGVLDVVASKDNIQIKIVSSDAKFNNTVSLFHLEDLYNMHKIELHDFLERYKNYRYPKLKEIAALLQNSQIDKNTLEKYILGFPVLDDKEYPLKKFKKDIKKQLDNS